MYIYSYALFLASFYGNSYIYIAYEDASHQTDLMVEFRTLHETGLLFLAKGQPDYCLLELQNGQLRLHIDLGSGEATLSSTPDVYFNDFNWHNVHITRANEKVKQK